MACSANGIVQRQRPDVSRRALQHRHVACTRIHQSRNQGHCGSAGPDHDDLLARVVEVLRPVLRMDDGALEVVVALEGRQVALVVVVVTAAREQERARHLALLAVVVDGERPSIVGVRPLGGQHPVAVADVFVDAVLRRGLFDVGLDRRTVGDRCRRLPRLEPEAQGEHVRVGTNPGVAEQVPGATQVGAALQDRVALGRAAVLQMPRRADAGDAGADDDNVEVFGHGVTLSTPC